MIKTFGNGGILITGRRDTLFASLCALKGAVGLERIGLKHSHGSMTAVAKRRFNLKGNREKVFAQLVELIERCMKSRETGDCPHCGTYMRRCNEDKGERTYCAKTGLEAL